MANSVVERKAKEMGYSDKESMITQLIAEHKTSIKVAKILGVTDDCVNVYLRQYGLSNSYQAKRARVRKQMDAWNDEHGTEFKDTKHFLAHMYHEFGAAKAADITGANRNYIRDCAVKVEMSKKNTALNPDLVRLTDDRGPTVPGKWTDPYKSPCRGVVSPCKYIHRNKLEPGCVNCERIKEFESLQYKIAQDGPQQSGVYNDTIMHGMGTNMSTPNTWSQVY